ncbi:MAG TPA: aquaporin [Methylomirabilota bacterium]|nr:aquaporin [Methylomirabilota bacterium]
MTGPPPAVAVRRAGPVTPAGAPASGDEGSRRGGVELAAAASAPAGARVALGAHWPEYAIEAAGLAAFMVVACAVATLLEHPASPVRQALPDPRVRRVPIGLAMGLTAVALIYSPWGRRSGAHFNPALTLAFWRLGKVRGWDAAFYPLAHFAGGLAGVGVAWLGLGAALADARVRFAATVPGPAGAGVAFAAELGMTFVLMAVVLVVSNRPGLARWTGLSAAALVALYIVLEAPLSGMSLNPARTVGSAVWAGAWPALWVYLTAPPLGMLLAAEAYARAAGAAGVRCAKLQHDGDGRCIFRCGYDFGPAGPRSTAPGREAA